MAGYRNHTLRSDDGVLFDVPLPESPVTVAVQPRSLPAYGSTGLASDLGFGGLHETSSSREINDSVSAREHSGESIAPLPVPTISQGMIPFSGLHLLSGLDVIEIQQTVELADLMSHVESENRYVVRSVRGETLLVAAECSSEAQRRCLGSSRALTLRVYDPSRQESLHLSRRLACGAGACALLGCCFYLQRVEVLQPPGRPLGSVEQAWSLVVPVLHVKDLTGGLLYRVEGPSPQPWSCSLKEAVFKITGRDGLVELGSISHMWKSSLSSFVTRIVFPSAELDVRHKALLLSAAFLLEYMYFESSKRKSRFPCCS